MKNLLLFLVMSIFVEANAQEWNHRKFDEKKQQEILIGKCNKQAFMQDPFKQWFVTEYERYHPNNEILLHAKKYINEQLKIVVIFGSWCSDTQEQLPRFMKVLDYIGYTPDMLELIAVDGNKNSETIDISQYKIEKIPTFIFYKKGKEIGRIVETPTQSFEKDIVKILK